MAADEIDDMSDVARGCFDSFVIIISSGLLGIGILSFGLVKLLRMIVS